MPFIEDENGNHILDENGNKLEYSITVFNVYRKKQWCYTKTYKRLKKWKLAGDLTSVGFATGGITFAIAAAGVSLKATSSNVWASFE